MHEVVKDFALDGGTPVRVLHGIRGHIALGQLTMLVGPSGCGKTTLISILSGILSPTSGSVTVLGVPLTALKDHEKVLFRRQHIGFIFQQFNLLPTLTAAENAAIPLLAAGAKTRQALEASRATLASLGMADHAGKLPSQLSGGQQQRVAIARALVHNPRLIICDEPTASLDAQTGLSVLEALCDHARRPDKAVLVVTHDNRIFSFADRILTMSDGRLVQDTQTPLP
jgi:putative ABC transport system ATP-binding protein